MADNFLQFFGGFQTQKGRQLSPLSLLPEDILPLFKFSQITDLAK